MENTKFIQPEPNFSIQKSDRPVGMVIPTQNKDASNQQVLSIQINDPRSLIAVCNFCSFQSDEDKMKSHMIEVAK